MRNNDAKALEQIIADDWRIISGNGEVTTKDETLSALRSGLLKYESVTFKDVEVWTYPGVAVVMGRSQLQGTQHGQPFDDSIIFTDLFIPRDGQWRSVLSQITHISPKGTDKTAAADSSFR